MGFKNKATQKGFNEWWDRDYIKQFTIGFRDNEEVKWLLAIAFEGGINLALLTLQEGISPLTSTTTEKLE